MQDKKVLVISSEVTPYLPETNISINSFQSAKQINKAGGQTRIFMPRYGIINERRHQLHEVIRLSGMNLVINDMDTPLVIKVASIPKERMQVYFIDNDEYFKRKQLLKDEEKKLFEDNDERMIFFTKGVIETVKKLNWAPDIVYLHGWFASLFPLYMKTYFAKDSVLDSSKIVTSVYSQDYEGVISSSFLEKVIFDGVKENQDIFQNTTFENIMKLAIQYSDGIVLSDENISPEVISFIDKLKKPVLAFKESQEEEVKINFFNQHFL